MKDYLKKYEGVIRKISMKKPAGIPIWKQTCEVSGYNKNPRQKKLINDAGLMSYSVLSKHLDNEHLNSS